MTKTSPANQVPTAILSSPLHPLLSRHRVAEALTALIRAHPPYRRWAHVRLDTDGTPDATDVAARGRVLVRVELPDDDDADR